MYGEQVERVAEALEVCVLFLEDFFCFFDVVGFE